MASDAEIAGIAVPWSHNGKTYLLGKFQFDDEFRFQAMFEANASMRLEARRKKIGEVRYEAELRIQSDKLDVNEYAFGTNLFFRFLFSREGSFEYILQKIQKGQTLGGEPITRDQLRQIQMKEPDAWEELVRTILRQDFPPNEEAGASSSGAPATPGPSTTE
jgi:hypothetical protein